MCSSPKASHTSHRSGTRQRPTQLSGRQQADFAAKANAAWELREQRRQQRKAHTTAPAQPPITAATGQLSGLQRLWLMLFRSDSAPPADRPHSAQ
jgi:hypothetical protein